MVSQLVKTSVRDCTASVLDKLPGTTCLNHRSSPLLLFFFSSLYLLWCNCVLIPQTGFFSLFFQLFDISLSVKYVNYGCQS